MASFGALAVKLGLSARLRFRYSSGFGPQSLGPFLFDIDFRSAAAPLGADLPHAAQPRSLPGQYSFCSTFGVTGFGTLLHHTGVGPGAVGDLVAAKGCCLARLAFASAGEVQRREQTDG